MASAAKRKRESGAQDEPTQPPYGQAHGDPMRHTSYEMGLGHGTNPNIQQNGNAHPGNPSDTAAAALNQYTMNLPSSTEQQFLASEASNDQFHGSPTLSSSEFNIAGESHASGAHHGSTPKSGKPVVGTEEWHQARKDSHKEVERRRREMINEGINELGKIVPSCEKENKGQVLARAVQYIGQLKDNENGNIEKWTLEKLVAEQVIKDLAKRNEALQVDIVRMRAERDEWKRLAGGAGVDVATLESSVIAKGVATMPDGAGEAGEAGKGEGAAELEFEQ